MQNEISALPKVSSAACDLLKRIAKYNDAGERFKAGSVKRNVGRPVYGSPLRELESAKFIACSLGDAVLTADGATLAAWMCS